ncbi:hypothetical protein Mal15_39040 [Stieleria maiorica]|uniref:Tetratricopeptide repeat protein n=1 Tax=Stieleria maiorica TaxID=2795974 RepID=A0A5B9MLU1_9BACT|nr:hypothetical protein [Stieleria maiorica]QEF99837.1 hypothetical protein Mal15_39040 [Stieleria maiorica]
MSDSDSKTASSAGPSSESKESFVESGNPNLSPLDGGRWRPVSPGELLRKNVPGSHDDLDDEQREHHRTVRLERRQELEHKLKANPTDLDGFLELAAIYRSEHRPLEAKRLLQQATEIFPDEERITFQLEEAILARSLQQYREVSDLASRLKTPEADRELERSRGDWAMRRIEVCQARLARDPSQVQLRLAMADAKFDAEMFEEAFADAGHLLELDEFSPQAHFLRARCLLALGKDLPAMKELRAVALRRSVVAPDTLRLASLKLLCDLADKHSLDATGHQYHAHLKRLQETGSQSKP